MDTTKLAALRCPGQALLKAAQVRSSELPSLSAPRSGQGGSVGGWRMLFLASGNPSFQRGPTFS